MVPVHSLVELLWLFLLRSLAPVAVVWPTVAVVVAFGRTCPTRPGHHSLPTRPHLWLAIGDRSRSLVMVLTMEWALAVVGLVYHSWAQEEWDSRPSSGCPARSVALVHAFCPQLTPPIVD